MNHFQGGLRLKKASEFRYVFSKAKRFSTSCLSCFVRLNDNGLARLGLAISKKCSKKAVQRNLIKRIVRESFRQADLDVTVDIVVTAHKSICKLSNEQLRRAIDKQWQDIHHYFKTSVCD